MQRIDSTANERVKAWRTLHKRRERDRQGLCLVEGARELTRALAGGLSFAAVLIGDGATPADLRIADAVASRGGHRFELSAPALSKVSVRANPSAVIGIAHTPPFSLETVTVPPNPLILVADNIEKPGNLGAMIRSADGAGADAVIVADPVSDVANPNVIRSSQGAVFTCPVAAGAAADVAAWLADRNISTVAATAEAATELWDHDFTMPTAIVIGSEHSGLSAHWRALNQVSIPMAGISDSLNASVAAALTMYEAHRQRR